VNHTIAFVDHAVRIRVAGDVFLSERSSLLISISLNEISMLSFCFKIVSSSSEGQGLHLKHLKVQWF
jgi:hypothetical protein